MGLAFGLDRAAIEASREDEYAMPQSFEDGYPLLGLECDAVDVANPTNDHSDVQSVLALVGEWTASRPVVPVQIGRGGGRWP